MSGLVAYSLKDLLCDLQANKIECEQERSSDGELLSLSVGGFSKAGEARIAERFGKLLCHTRYDTIHEIRSFDDVVEVAWDWFDKYKDRQPFTRPDYRWVAFFIERGWLQEVHDVSYEVIR